MLPITKIEKLNYKTIILKPPEESGWYRSYAGCFFLINSNISADINNPYNYDTSIPKEEDIGKIIENNISDLKVFNENQLECFSFLTFLKYINKEKIIWLEPGAAYGNQVVFVNHLIKHKLCDTKVKDIKFILNEAEPNHYKWLSTHLEKQNITNVEKYCEAIYTHDGYVSFSIDESKSASWYGQAIAPDGTSVPCKSLLTYINNINDEIDMLWLDIQGSEYEVLKSLPIDKLLKINWIQIGTHRHDIHNNIKTLLSPFYNLLLDIPLFSKNYSTYLGTASEVGDGMLAFCRK